MKKIDWKKPIFVIFKSPYLQIFKAQDKGPDFTNPKLRCIAILNDQDNVYGFVKCNCYGETDSIASVRNLSNELILSEVIE